MRKLIYLSAFTALFLIGCTDLTEEVYNKIPKALYPENPEQVSALSVDAYAQLKPFADDGGWWFLAQEVSSDEICFPTRDTDWDDGGKWRVLYQHNWSNNTDAVNSMWRTMWAGVTTCNQIIDQLKLLPQTDAVISKVSEVEVMRSFYYYLLIDNYGNTPYLTTTIDAPAQPELVSRTEVYNKLISLIETNLSSLKMIDKKYMATRYMGFALLAKLYLNAEVYTGTPQWEKAGSYCDSILAGPFKLEASVLAPFVTENENSKEIIFSIPYDEDDFQGFRLHMRTLHYQHNLKYNMAVGPWNGGCVVEDHFKTYTANDARLNWFIYGPQYASDGSQIIDESTKIPLVINPHLNALRMDKTNTPEEIRASGARIGKYEIKKGAKESLSNDLPLFRLADFYLMKAETEIRLGRNGDKWVNPIRSRAGVEPWTGTTLDMLLAERGREMFAEGHRRQDLIRFGKFEQAWWEKEATDASFRTFPIPKWATDANPNLLK
jgi:hypothetical protein